MPYPLALHTALTRPLVYSQVESHDESFICLADILNWSGWHSSDMLSIFIVAKVETIQSEYFSQGYTDRDVATWMQEKFPTYSSAHKVRYTYTVFFPICTVQSATFVWKKIEIGICDNNPI